MSTVAKALDQVQGEANAYLGILLPIISITVYRLHKEQEKSLRFCAPLVDALLGGINRRFYHLCDDRECQLASAFHPKFRLHWLKKFNEEKCGQVLTAVEGEVENYLIASGSGPDNTQRHEEDSEDFFSDILAKESTSTSSTSDKAKKMVQEFMEQGSGEVSDLLKGEKVWLDLFLKYNTSIPSSAAVERLFSAGKDIFRDKRANMSDTNFEKLMFMRGNCHLESKFLDG